MLSDHELAQIKAAHPGEDLRLFEVRGVGEIVFARPTLEAFTEYMDAYAADPGTAVHNVLVKHLRHPALPEFLALVRDLPASPARMSDELDRVAGYAPQEPKAASTMKDDLAAAGVDVAKLSRNAVAFASPNGVGLVVFNPPDRDAWELFTQRRREAPQTALLDLATNCVAFPDHAAFRAMLSQAPAFVSVVGPILVKLAGAAVEVRSKKI